MLQKHSFQIFCIVMFIFVLMTSSVWINKFLPTTPTLIGGNLLMLVCLIPHSASLKIDTKCIWILALIICIGVWFTEIKGMVMGIYYVLCFLPSIFLYILPYQYKYYLLKFCTKWFSICIGIGLIIYFITLFISLPPLGIFIKENNDFYPPFSNYIFFIKPFYNLYQFRYNAFFLEPGHLAISTIFFIAANDFRITQNRYLQILVVGIIASFSLAGYLLLVIGWCLLRMKHTKNFILIALALSGTYLISQTWNSGNNLINELIISRLELNEETGIEGNNRTNDRTDSMFKNLLQSDTLLTGLPNAENLRIFGAGYKKYLLINGLISAILIFSLYWLLKNSSCNRRYGIGLIILVFLTWCDCEYLTWYTWILPYTLGTGIHLSPKSLSDQSHISITN